MLNDINVITLVTPFERIDIDLVDINHLNMSISERRIELNTYWCAKLEKVYMMDACCISIKNIDKYPVIIKNHNQGDDLILIELIIGNESFKVTDKKHWFAQVSSKQNELHIDIYDN